MTIIAVLTFGIGVFLVYDALTLPDRQIHSLNFRARCESRLAAAGLGDVAPSKFFSSVIGAAVGSGFIALLVTSSVAIAFIAAVSGACVPLAVVRSKLRARQRVFLEAWPDAIDLLAGAIRAGDTLAGAIAVVGERGPQPLRPVFRTLDADYRLSGDLPLCLVTMASQLSDPTGDRVAITLSLAHDVGGRELGRVLRTLADFLRENLALRKEIQARQSWTLVAARVASAAPWIVLLLIATRPEAGKAFNSFSGSVVLLVGAGLTVLGYRVMVALGRLPNEPRVMELQ